MEFLAFSLATLGMFGVWVALEECGHRYGLKPWPREKQDVRPSDADAHN